MNFKFTFDELVELCSQYDDVCDIFVYAYHELESRYRFFALRDFGVHAKSTREQLIQMMLFTSKIEYIDIRSELIRIQWQDVTDKPII